MSEPLTLTSQLLKEAGALRHAIDGRFVLAVTVLVALAVLLHRGLLGATRIAWRLGWDRRRRLGRARSLADAVMVSVTCAVALGRCFRAAPFTTGIAVLACALVIAVALPAWVQDLTAGLALATRVRFREGDQVRVSTTIVGSVRHIGLFRTAFRTSDGGTLSIPNRDVLHNAIQVAREQRAAPVELRLPATATATPTQRDHLLRIAHLNVFRRAGSRPTLIETQQGWTLAMQTWCTRNVESVRRSLERQLLGDTDRS